jgi:hypothetical protein
MDIKKIILPNKPQFDPLAALYILRTYGLEKFPGVETAELSYWEYSHDPSEEEIAKFRAEGALAIDMGGGLFDHHSLKEEGRETATAMVASYLGVDTNPELSALLTYAREDDLEGLHNRYGDMAYVIKAMYKQKKSNQEVVDYALNTIKILQDGQREWHVEVKKEVEEKCKIIKVKRFKKKIKVGIIESDNIQAANYGITVMNLSVVIQKRLSGHVFVFTNKHHRIDLREIVAAIRKRELELRGNPGQIDPRSLQFEGKNQLVSNWFYHKSLNSLLNGSDALYKVEPTAVPFNEIIRFVMYGISSEESKLCDCATGGNTCPYVNYGFSRCRSGRLIS